MLIIPVFSVVAVAFFLSTGVDSKWKTLAATLVASSILMQFVPQLGVHHLIPYFVQGGVCFWMAVYWYYV